MKSCLNDLDSFSNASRNVDSIGRYIASIRLECASNRWSFLHVCCCIVIDVDKSIVPEHCSNSVEHVVELDRVKSSFPLDLGEYSLELMHDKDHYPFDGFRSLNGECRYFKVVWLFVICIFFL